MHRLLVLIAAGALLLAGCGTATSTGSGGDGGSTSSQAAGAPGNGAAWEFTGTTLAGETFDGKQIAGTPTVLWFWAPWCPTCRAQIPNLTVLAEKYDGEVEFLGVGSLSDERSIKQVAEQVPHLTHLIDVEGKVWQKFGVTAQSTYQVIDADGAIISSGYLDDGELEKLVAEMAG